MLSSEVILSFHQNSDQFLIDNLMMLDTFSTNLDVSEREKTPEETQEPEEEPAETKPETPTPAGNVTVLID